MSRSAAIRRITASCWKSFSPNSATSGRTWLNNLATTVATPSKCPGRVRAVERLAHPRDRDVGREAGRIHHLDRRHPQHVDPGFREHAPNRSAPCADSWSKSSSGPNCFGLTKIDATTPPAAALRRLDQRHVPGVERAHRRDQCDALALGPETGNRLAERFELANGLHALTPSGKDEGRPSMGGGPDDQQRMFTRWATDRTGFTSSFSPTRRAAPANRRPPSTPRSRWPRKGARVVVLRSRPSPADDGPLSRQPPGDDRAHRPRLADAALRDARRQIDRAFLRIARPTERGLGFPGVRHARSRRQVRPDRGDQRRHARHADERQLRRFRPDRPGRSRDVPRSRAPASIRR